MLLCIPIFYIKFTDHLNTNRHVYKTTGNNLKPNCKPYSSCWNKNINIIFGVHLL